jgi:hypothetical protein
MRLISSPVAYARSKQSRVASSYPATLTYNAQIDVYRATRRYDCEAAERCPIWPKIGTDWTIE